MARTFDLHLPITIADGDERTAANLADLLRRHLEAPLPQQPDASGAPYSARPEFGEIACEERREDSILVRLPARCVREAIFGMQTALLRDGVVRAYPARRRP